MRSIIAVVALQLCIAGNVYSQTVIETWNCKDRFQPSETLLVAKIYEGRKFGELEVAGITHTAEFRIAGIERRWNFEPDEKNGSYVYSLVILPNGSADYYDFSYASPEEAVAPRVFFECTQIG